MKAVTLPHKLEKLLNILDEEQLQILHDKVWERLELLRKAQDLQELSYFSVHDRVTFTHQGRVLIGTIVRLNRRTASIVTDSGRRWKVHPNFLHPIVENINMSPYADTILR